MSMVGANIEGLRTFGQQLDSASQKLAAAQNELEGLLAQGVWHGPDADDFRQQWKTVLRLHLQRASTALHEASGHIGRQADDQEGTSDTLVGGASAGGRNTPNLLAGNADYGRAHTLQPHTLDHEIEAQWRDGSMTDKERLAILQMMAEDLAVEYGVEPPNFYAADLQDALLFRDNLAPMNLFGLWSEEGQRIQLAQGPWFTVSPHTLAFDTSDLTDPSIAIDTVAHEMRHAAQHEWARDYESFLKLTPADQDMIRMGFLEDPFPHTEVTPAMAGLFGHNLRGYIGPDQNFDAYWEQAVEQDARYASSNYVKNLTVEQFEDYRNRYTSQHENDMAIIRQGQSHR